MLDNVQRGIELLDQQVPGWRERIDWDRLDMGYSRQCVLGQVFGNYPHGVGELQVNGQQYGFDVPKTKPTLGDYAELTYLWQQIAEVQVPAPGGGVGERE